MKRIALLTLFLITTYIGHTTCTPFTVNIPSDNTSGPSPVTITNDVYIITTNAGSCPASITMAETMSVEIKNFVGYYKNERVHIEWITSLEKNNDYYEIQRMEGDNWITIGRQPGQVNTFYDTHYTFTDFQPGDGYVRYRLKQVDLDGKYSLSDIITIYTDRSGDVKIFPNPVRDKITISSNKNEKFQIVDTMGKIVLQSGKAAGLDMSHLPEGIYFVVLFDENDLIKSQTKVLKL